MELTKGSISVFLCIVLIAVSALGGLFADAARLGAAKRQAMNAADMAIRSVMAGYDSMLSGQYGLFALDCSDTDKTGSEFVKYFKANLGISGGANDMLNFRDNGVECNVIFKGNKAIIDTKVFREQIMDFMKYRGALHTGEYLAGKIQDAMMQEKLDFMKKEKAVRENRRNVINGISKVNDGITKSCNYQVCGGAGDIAGIRSAFEEIRMASLDMEAMISGYNQAESEALNAAETCGAAGNPAGAGEFSGISGHIKKIAEISAANIVTADNALSLMQPLESELADIWVELDSLLAERVDTLIKGETAVAPGESALAADTAGSEAAGKIKAIDKKIRAAEENAADIVTAISRIAGGCSFEQLDRIVYTEAEDSEKDDTSHQLQQNPYKEIMNFLSGEYSGLFNNIDSAWLDIYYNSLQAYENRLASEPEEGGSIQQGRGATAWESAEWERTMAKGSKETGISMPAEYEAEEQSDCSIDFLEALFGAIKSAGEKMLLVEYILTNYSYLTSRNGPGAYLEKGECEYIIWGGINQAGNIAKNLGCVWGFRFAVCLADYFIVSANPNPVFRLIHAAAKASLRACIDTAELFCGRSVEFLPSFSIFRIDYRDCLGIFLLTACTADEESVLGRACQLIMINKIYAGEKHDMSYFLTDFEVTAEAEVRLWFGGLFLPEAICAEREGRSYYKITHTVRRSY